MNAIEETNYALTYTVSTVPQADGGRLRIQSKRAGVIVRTPQRAGVR